MIENWQVPTFIAHRGGGVLAPENTLAAIEIAAAHGYKAIELDVKLAQGGEAIVLHDETLERTTNGTGYADDMTLDDLRKLDAGSWFSSEYSNQHLPILSEVPNLCAKYGLLVNLDIHPTTGRDAETGSVVAYEAETLWAERGLPAPMISSSSSEALEYAVMAGPGLTSALTLLEWDNDWQELVEHLGCSAVQLADEIITAERVAELQTAGLMVMVKLVNDPVRVSQLLEWGVACICTDELDQIAPLTA